VTGSGGGPRGGPGWIALVAGLVLVLVGGAALLLSFGAIASITATVLVAGALIVVGMVVLAWAIVPARRRPTTVTVERQDVRLGVERSAGEARVRLSRDVTGWDPFGAGTWRVQAAADLPLALEVQGGAGRFDVDLFALRLAGAALYVGAAEVRCRLPVPAGDVRVRVEAGAASIRLEVPAGVAYRARTEGFVTRSGALEGGGYATATDRLTIEMTGGAASLTIT
jgi:hypothetical protein